MDALRNLFHGRDHPSWREVYQSWHRLVWLEIPHTQEFFSAKYKDWNPWLDWCKSWEKYKSSNGKSPKSERPKEAVFYQLSTIAKLTRDKLEEAKIKAQENQSLTNENFVLKKQCDELQRMLDAERQLRMKNDYLFKCSLEKEASLKRELQVEVEKLAQLTRDKLEEVKVKAQQNQSLTNKNFVLKRKCDELQRKLDAERKKEASLQRELEVEKQDRTFQDMQREELKKAESKCSQLEDRISDYEDELMDYIEKLNCQMIKNDKQVIPVSNGNGSPRGSQLVIVDGQRWLDPDCIKYILKRFGKVNSSNEESECIYVNYGSIQLIVLSAGHLWMVIEDRRENSYWKKRKAGAGCPSRRSIWKRLEKYPVPYEEIHNAPYWKLLVYLSRYEDLETQEMIIYKKCHKCKKTFRC